MRCNRHRADDGFNWKLSVTLYLSCEAFVVGLLRPRVYKKIGDTVVEVSARLFLLSVLVLGMYSDLVSNLQNEGDAIRADDSYCTLHGEERCGEVDHCEWGASNSLCTTTSHPFTRIGFLQHVLWGLPGLAPLVVNQIFKRLERKKKPPVPADEKGADDPVPVPSEQCIVARVYCTTKGTQVRHRLSSEQGGARSTTPPRGASGSAASIDPADFEATFLKAGRLERWPEESAVAELDASVDEQQPEPMGSDNVPGDKWTERWSKE